MIPHWITEKVIAWSLYDFADTAFSALYVTFFFPILIKVHLGGNEFQIGLAMGLSLFLSGIMVPLIGAIADATGRKIPVLFFTTLVATFFIAITGYIGLYTALVAGFLANLFNLLDVDLYDSQLTDIADSGEQGRVSGFGTAIGYLGTHFSLLMAYWIMNAIGWDKKEAVRAIFPATAAFYFIFSLPLFFFIKDLPKPKIHFNESFKKALAALQYTITKITEIKGLGSFLLASFIYTNAVNAVIVFLSLYATQVIGLSVQEFFVVFAIFAGGSFLGAFGFGKISDALGPRKALAADLIVWILTVIYLINIAPLAKLLNLSLVAAFVLGGFVGGAALGPIWAGNRHLIARIAPSSKRAELFGMKGLTENFSGVIGPILFGWIVNLAGRGNETIGYQNALWSTLVFFILGLIVLWQIPKETDFYRTDILR